MYASAYQCLNELTPEYESWRILLKAEKLVPWLLEYLIEYSII